MAGDERVQFVLTAKDQATATVKRLKGELGALGGTAASATGPLGRLSAVTGGMISPMTLGIGAALGIAGAFSVAAKAALEEEKGVALLTQAIEANDPAAVGNLATIEATITQRQNLAFADDEQRESLGALIAVTKDSEKALDLQRIAMDLARLKGMSLADATGLIGKVAAGNVGILRRYGIVLDEGATSTEALAEIQRRSAGQAEAYAQTSAGALESLGLVVDDLVEDVGAMLLPVLKDLAIFARDTLVPALKAVVDNGKLIGDVIGGIWDAVSGPLGAATNAANDASAEIKAEAKAAEEAVIQQGREWEATYRQMYPEIVAAATKLAEVPKQAIQATWAKVRAAAFEQAVQFQLGILDGQNGIKVAMEALTRLQTEEMTKAQRIAYLQGILSDQKLAAGLNDGRPGVRGAARTIVAEATAELAGLGVNANRYGVNAGNELAAGLRSRYGVVRTAAGTLAQAINGQIGIRSEPSDPSSPLRGITKFGGNIVKTIADGMVSQLGTAVGAASAVAGSLVPGFGASGMALAGAGVTNNYTVNINGNPRVDSAEDIALQLRRVERMKA